MATYNNGFPVSYPQMYYPQQYQQPMPVMQQPMTQQMQPQQATQPQPMPQAHGSTMIWIQGEAGAKSYMVAPNTTVPLWDSESQRVYLKSVDAAGMPSMKILNYTIEETPNIGAPAQKAVTGPVSASDHDKEYAAKSEQDALKQAITGVRSDIEAIRAELETFRGDLYGIAGKKPSTNAKKKEALSDE